MTTRKPTADHAEQRKPMFENLTVETAERRAAPRIVEVDPQVVEIVKKAWEAQKDDMRNMGHIVALANAAEVKVFHEQARSACEQNDPALKYRRLARVGVDKSEKKAYFSLQLLSEYKAQQAAESSKESPAESAKEPAKEPAKESPAESTAPATPAKAPHTPPARRTTK